LNVGKIINQTRYITLIDGGNEQMNKTKSVRISIALLDICEKFETLEKLFKGEKEYKDLGKELGFVRGCK
jgi:hypothetical protein